MVSIWLALKKGVIAGIGFQTSASGPSTPEDADELFADSKQKDLPNGDIYVKDGSWMGYQRAN